jgi:predicted ArsR family transcriptional regulator
VGVSKSSNKIEDTLTDATAEREKLKHLTDTSSDIARDIGQITDAFGDPTRRGIYLMVRESDGVSASVVAERFSLHPNVARHHLDKLVTWGYLESYTEKLDSKAGRPTKRYKASSKVPIIERERRQFELLSLLLSKTLDALPLSVAESIAYEVGENYGLRIAASLSDQELLEDPKHVVTALADALSAHGFTSKTVSRREDLMVINEVCPFGTVAIEHPVLCAVERGIVAGLISKSKSNKLEPRVNSRALGDLDCSVVI